MSINLISKMRTLEIDHEPDGWPAVQMKDISELCDMIDKQKWPAVDLLEKYLANFHILLKQDNKWWLFDIDGEGIASGKSLRSLLLNLILVDC